MTRLRLFVYGSLKRGFGNHNRYCRGVCSMEEANIEGRLYQMPTGYPVLRIPESLILERGSGDFSADMERQGWYAEIPERAAVGPARSSSKSANRVHGVVLTFANPIHRLRAIDVLEEFRPGHRSRYERVLITVYSRLTQSAQPAWTYIAGGLSPRGREIPSARWPGRRS